LDGSKAKFFFELSLKIGKEYNIFTFKEDFGSKVFDFEIFLNFKI
jgi:hypothetical protein